MGGKIFKFTGNQKSTFQNFPTTSSFVENASLTNETIQIEQDLLRSLFFLGSQEDYATFKKIWENSNDSNYIQGNMIGGSSLPKYCYEMDPFYVNLRNKNAEHYFGSRVKFIEFGYLENNIASGFSIVFDPMEPKHWIIHIMKNANAPSFEKRESHAYWSDAMKIEHPVDPETPLKVTKKETIPNIQTALVDSLASAPEHAAFLKYIILPNGEVNTEITDPLETLVNPSTNSDVLDKLKKITSPTETLLSEIKKRNITFALPESEKKPFQQQRIIKTTEPAQEKLFNKIETIDKQIKILEKKADKLKRKYPNDEVGVTLETLSIQLRHALNTALSEETLDKAAIETFEKKSERYIQTTINKKDKNGEKILDRHRGAVKIVYNVALAIAGLGVLYGIAVGIHYWATGGKHTLFQPPPIISTDSEKQVQNLRQLFKPKK